MSNKEIGERAQGAAQHIKIAGLLWAVAMMIVMASAVAWIVTALATGDYYASSKTVRDAAAAGTELLSQQGRIEAVKAWVLPLAFLGLGTFLLGFGIAFGNILRNVRLRGDTLAAVLPAFKAGQRYCEACADIKPPHRHKE